MNRDREYNHGSTKDKSRDASVANDEGRHDKHRNSVDRHRSREDRERSEDSYERERREKSYEMEGDFWSRRSSKRKERVESEDGGGGGDDQRVRVSHERKSEGNRVRKEVEKGDCVEEMVKKEAREEQVDSPRPGPNNPITDMSGGGCGCGDTGKRQLVEVDDYDLRDYNGRMHMRCVTAPVPQRGPSNPSSLVSSFTEVAPFAQGAPPGFAPLPHSNIGVSSTLKVEKQLQELSPGVISRGCSKGIMGPLHFLIEYQRREEDVGKGRDRHILQHDDEEDDEDIGGYGHTLARVGRIGLGHGRGRPILHHVDEEDDDAYEEEYVDVDGVRGRGGRGGRGTRAQLARGRGRGDGGANGARLTEPYTGGPQIPDILSGFLGHVAHAIWNGEERGVLKYQVQTERLSSWAIVNATTLEHIVSSNLLHLRESMFHHLNMPLISAFVERWHPETNSFHLPFGEMTITLHDVWHILRIPVIGKPLISHTDVGVIRCHVENLLGMTTNELKVELKSSSVRFRTLQERLSHSNVDPANMAIGYLLWLLGASLFVDKSQTRVSIHFLPFLLDIDTIPSYAWGAATLAFLYRHLGMASRTDTQQIAGCMTLLEAWIYEYFPTFRPAKKGDWKPHMPCSQKWLIGSTRRSRHGSLEEYRRMLDRFTCDMVNWTPFGKDPAADVPITLFTGIIHCRNITEPYMPERCIRQFGYVQYIPDHDVIIPIKVYRGRNPQKYRCEHEVAARSWNAWDYSLVRPTDKAMFPDQAHPNYLPWFIQRSHPRVTPPHEHAAAANNNNDNESGDISLPPEARLQYVASRMKFTRADYRHNISDEQLWRMIDEVNDHLKDLM